MKDETYHMDLEGFFCDEVSNKRREKEEAIDATFEEM